MVFPFEANLEFGLMIIRFFFFSTSVRMTMIPIPTSSSSFMHLIAQVCRWSPSLPLELKSATGAQICSWSSNLSPLPTTNTIAPIVPVLPTMPASRNTTTVEIGSLNPVEIGLVQQLDAVHQCIEQFMDALEHRIELCMNQFLPAPKEGTVSSATSISGESGCPCASYHGHLEQRIDALMTEVKKMNERATGEGSRQRQALSTSASPPGRFIAVGATVVVTLLVLLLICLFAIFLFYISLYFCILAMIHGSRLLMSLGR